MKKLIYAFMIAALVASCGSSGEKEQHGFTVRGKIVHGTGKVIQLNELTTRGLRLVDSATVNDDGTFEFTGSITEKIFCTIMFPKGTAVIVLDTNSSVNISIDADLPEQFGVTGSPDTEELKELLKINTKYVQFIRNLEGKYEQYGNDVPPTHIQNQMREEYDSLLSSRKTELQQAALAAQSPLVSYFATNFLMPESDFDFLEKVDTKFYGAMHASRYAQELHSRVEDLKKTAVGQIAPDIVKQDPFGKTISLSSLRGKYVLIDFWASWCKPCRQESPHLVAYYNKYRNRGFDIFSVSLDDNRDAWQKAINDDKLLWTHVSDLMKWNSDVVGKYKIEGIPFTVLIDKEGKIIAKNLRGEALDKKLSEILM